MDARRSFDSPIIKFPCFYFCKFQFVSGNLYKNLIRYHDQETVRSVEILKEWRLNTWLFPVNFVVDKKSLSFKLRVRLFRHKSRKQWICLSLLKLFYKPSLFRGLFTKYEQNKNKIVVQEGGHRRQCRKRKKWNKTFLFLLVIKKSLNFR